MKGVESVSVFALVFRFSLEGCAGVCLDMSEKKKMRSNSNNKTTITKQKKTNEQRSETLSSSIHSHPRTVGEREGGGRVKDENKNEGDESK